VITLGRKIVYTDPIHEFMRKQRRESRARRKAEVLEEWKKKE